MAPDRLRPGLSTCRRAASQDILEENGCSALSGLRRIMGSLEWQDGKEEVEGGGRKWILPADDT